LHQSAGQEDMFPLELDLDLVRRQRETGMKGLGQVLKSFRDRSANFSVYDRSSGADAFLQSLGPLELPAQGSRRGLQQEMPGDGEGPEHDSGEEFSAVKFMSANARTFSG